MVGIELLLDRTKKKIISIEVLLLVDTECPVIDDHTIFNVKWPKSSLLGEKKITFLILSQLSCENREYQ